MKGLFMVLLFCLVSGGIRAQLSDNFSDADLKTNPAWLGNLDVFGVVDNELKLASTGSGKSYISTKATWKDTASWLFYFRLDFAPSTSNQLKIYLSFDNSDLTAAGNGYLLRIGKSGNEDNLEFCKQSGSTITKLAEGTLSSMGNLTTNQARIKITRSQKGEFIIQTDLSGGTSFTTDFSVSDNSFNEGEYFGFQCIYTSTRADKFFFDDVFIDPIFSDKVAPKLSSISVVSENSLELVFNEALDSATASEVNNYNLNAEKPVSLVFSNQNPNKLSLQFANNFVSGTTYTLEVIKVKDLAGNAISLETKSFNYFNVAYRDVIINEFFPDPSPSVALPDGEFVELYNSTNTDIDLLNWTISDAVSEVKIPAFTLKAGGYVILCTNAYSADYELLGDVISLSLPSLNNTGDKLILKSDKGKIIDKLSYDDSWYQDDFKAEGGYSLELINPDLVCTGRHNWRASTNSSGGTPGTQNSVFDNTPDKTAPQVLSFKVLSSTEIELGFSEPFDSISALNATYNVTGLGNAQATDFDFDELLFVRLKLATAMLENTQYSISISGIEDCEGNVLSKTFEDVLLYLIPVNPTLHQLLITEIFADPEPDYNLPIAEYVEIYNNSEKPIALNKCMLSAGKDQAFLGNEILMPYEYLIICKTSEAYLFESFGNVMGVSNFPSLNNGGELLSLYNKYGALLHFVDYNDNWYDIDVKKQGGYSLEMIDFENPCGKNENWTGAKNNVYGTPGSQNSQMGINLDLEEPKIINVSALDSLSLQLSFSETIDSSSLYNLASYIFPNNIGFQVASLGENSGPYESLVLQLNKELAKNVVYQLQVSDLKDCAQNVASTQIIDFARPEKPLPFDLVINEVLFNPRTGGSDFVELYNRSGKYLDLADFLIASRNSEGELSSISALSEKGFLLAPGSFVALTEDLENILTSYYVAQNEQLLLVDLPSFSDAAGEVILLRADSLQIDALVYDADWHYPLLEDVEGVSLERINPEIETQNPANWHSASSASGGATPTFVNSQFSEKRPVENVISLSGESFSPDNDGYEDYLGISIASQSLNQSVVISIYNLSGQLVRNLVGHDILGAESFYQWDGFDNEGKKAPIGVYILLFEIIDLDSGRAEAYKLSTVLAGKL